VSNLFPSPLCLCPEKQVVDPFCTFRGKKLRVAWLSFFLAPTARSVLAAATNSFALNFLYQSAPPPAANIADFTGTKLSRTSLALTCCSIDHSLFLHAHSSSAASFSPCFCTNAAITFALQKIPRKVPGLLVRKSKNQLFSKL